MTRDRVFDTSRKGRQRKMHVRKRVRGTAACPRLSVSRSSRHIYAQLIDDDADRAFAAASSLSKELRGNGLDRPGNIEVAREVGKLVAEKAKAIGVEKVVFDRGSYKYHGRVKALAEGARDGGLKF